MQHRGRSRLTRRRGSSRARCRSGSHGTRRRSRSRAWCRSGCHGTRCWGRSRTRCRSRSQARCRSGCRGTRCWGMARRRSMVRSWRKMARRRPIPVRMVRNRTMRIPAVIAHVNHAGPPVKPARTPSPFAIPSAKPHAATIPDIGGIAIGTHIIDDTGIVHRHIDIFGTGRLDDNGCIHSHRDLLVRLQVAIVIGLMTQTLHGVEDPLLLGGDRIPKLVSPGRILGHHVQNRRERNQGLDARVIGQVGIFDRLGQGLPTLVLVGLGKSICSGNLVTESRCGEHMD